MKADKFLRQKFKGKCWFCQENIATGRLLFPDHSEVRACESCKTSHMRYRRNSKRKYNSIAFSKKTISTQNSRIKILNQGIQFKSGHSGGGQ